MLNATIRQRIAEAVVQLPETGAHGVIAEGGIVVTCAHCCPHPWNPDHPSESPAIEAWAGHERMLLKCVYREVERDLAILFTSDARAERIIEDIPGVQLWRGALDAGTYTQVYAPQGDSWITGRLAASGLTCSLDVSEPILAGTSGSPVISENGALMAVVAAGSGDQARAPLVFANLPYWLAELYVQPVKKVAKPVPARPR